jgi:hypothetical protein
MSKCDNPISSPCPCFYLPFEQGCYDCVTRPFETFVSHQIQDVLGHYQEHHPHMMCAHILHDAVQSAAYKSIWKHHTETPEEQCVPLARKAVEDAYHEFDTTRRLLIRFFIMPAIEECISQHFLQLTDKPWSPPTLNRSACHICSEDSYFEPFPPPQFREFLVEQILPLIYNSASGDDDKQLTAEVVCQNLTHKWIAASPEERVNMGV